MLGKVVTRDSGPELYNQGPGLNYIGRQGYRLIADRLTKEFVDNFAMLVELSIANLWIAPAGRGIRLCADLTSAVMAPLLALRVGNILDRVQ